MASPRQFPFDDDDRPSGSVRPLSQVDLQAILAHLSDDPDELLAGTGADRPVVALRVRASVGRPGGSAQARWRRMRAAEWAAWTRTLPWRLAAILGIGAGAGLLSSVLAPRLGLVVGGLAATAAGWGYGSSPAPRPSPGGVERPGSGELLGCSTRWSGTGGRSCTTWPRGWRPGSRHPAPAGRHQAPASRAPPAASPASAAQGSGEAARRRERASPDRRTAR